MSYNELREHKKGDKIKWIFTFIAILLCFVMIVGICLQVFGTGNQKPSEWFKQTETEDSETKSDNDVVFAEGESNGIRLMSARSTYSAASANTYDLSVTYTPADTTFKQTNFTVAFKNASSAWATGKTVTDYVTLTSTGDTTATLTVLKSFSEQIIVTATNNRNTSVKATTTVDYVGYINCRVDCEVSDIYCDIESTFTSLLNGTIMPESTNSITVTYQTYGRLDVQKMAALGYSVTSEVSYTLTPDLTGDADCFTSVRNILLKAGGFNTGHTDEEVKAYWQAVSTVVLDGDTPENFQNMGVFSYSVVSHRVYNGVTYDDVVLVAGDEFCLADWSGFEVSATSMTTNTSSIVAG